ncbi:MAG: hypothetical protein M3498_04470 [Deinococcota bacterium]|nr:hypothetical protein [Deinococcota bacterium]
MTPYATPRRQSRASLYALAHLRPRRPGAGQALFAAACLTVCMRLRQRQQATRLTLTATMTLTPQPLQR